MYVDPELKNANILNRDGIPLHTVDLKKLVDLNALHGTIATVYDKDTGTLIQKDGDCLYKRMKMGMTGEIVFAYKFGYGNNKSFSKIKNILNYTTLLYAPFTLPRLYLVKYCFLYGFILSLIVILLAGIVRLLIPK